MRWSRGKRKGGRSGFSIIWVLVVVGGLFAAAMVIAPNMVQSRSRQRASGEERNCELIGEAYRSVVRKTQTIPGTNGWVAAVALELGWDDTKVRQVFPEFAQDAGSQRVVVIDPAFTPSSGVGVLPWTQSPAGWDPLLGTVPGVNSRLMILSSSRRDLSLPLLSGVLASGLFGQLWDWVPILGSSTVPLAALDPRWVGQDQHLHVAHVELASLFHKVTLRQLRYGVGGSVPLVVSNTIERYFLTGTTLELYLPSNGTDVKIRHTLDRDATFDLTESVAPLVWYKANEAAGYGALLNWGSLGDAALATARNGALNGGAGPSPPSQSFFPVGNLAAIVDGVDDYFEAPLPLMSGLPEATVSAWIQPASVAPGRMQDFAGQQGVFSFGIWGNSSLKINTAHAGFFMVPYPHPAGEWHHVAVTLDGSSARVYLDGSLVSTYASPNVGGSIGTSSSLFRVGGGGVFNGTPDDFHGQLDEIMVFDRALSSSQIVKLAQNVLP